MDAGLKARLTAHRQRVDDALVACFDDVRPRGLRDASRWYPEAGGKRLRPVISMLACEAAGGRAEDALPVALAVELVHNFSLVHDDIMDRDATRRGRPTVHRKWDEPTAILAGDVLFARAFEELAGIDDPAAHREASRLLSTTILHLCEGQALDMAFEKEDDLRVEDYLDMIRGKTALLFEAAARGGGLCAKRSGGGDGDTIAALSTYGENLGMAFQIADDLLDLTGDSKTLGKPWGSDIRAGKRTVVILDALHTAAPPARAALLEALGRTDATDSDVAQAVDALRESGALDRAAARLDEYADRAAAALANLPPSEARDTLADLNEWARERRS